MLWLFAVGPFLAWIFEDLVIRFSYRAFSSSTGYAKGESLRDQVVNRSLLNVILLSFQSIVALSALNHGIPRMTSWFWELSVEGCQFRMATNVHRDFRHMGHRPHSTWLSVWKVNLPGVICFDHLDPVFVADFSVNEVFCCFSVNHGVDSD